MRATGSEIGRQEDVVQRVGKTDKRPGEPDERGADTDTLRRIQAAEVHAHLPEAPFALSFSTSSAVDGAAFLHELKCETAGPIVLICDELQRLYTFCVSALAYQELGCLLELNDRDTENRHDEDERTGSVPYVAPALIVRLCARRSAGIDGWIGAAVVWDESPGEEACDKLADTYMNVSLKSSSPSPFLLTWEHREHSIPHQAAMSVSIHCL